MRKQLYKEISTMSTEEQPLFDAEKERIMAHLKKEIRHKRPVFTALKALSAAAACFMLLVTACAFSPVLAKNMPFMQEIIRFLKQEEYPRNSVIASSNVEDFMQPVNDPTKDEMQILEAYCDGTALVLTVGLELPEIEDEILRIVPAVTVDVNGERLYPEAGLQDGRRMGMFLLYRTEDDRFLGALTMDISTLNPAEDLSVTLEITELTGEDPKHMVATSSNAYDPMYAPKTYTLENPTVPHTVQIPVDDALTREYAVEKTVGGLTAHKLITTPVCTYLETEYAEQNACYYVLTTDDGTELSFNKFDNAVSDGPLPKSYRDPLPEGTEKVIVTVYALEDDSTPLGTVEVPVEFGYGTPVDAYAVKHIPEEEIVYDPPRAEPASGPRNGEETVQLGETITSQAYRDIYLDPATGQQVYVNPDGKMEVTYSNMQVWASPAELGLTQDDMKQSELPLERDGCRFVTFDVQLTTHGIYGLRGEDLQDEIDAYEKKDDSTGIMWISDFAMPLAENLRPDAIRNDVAYFSNHMDGVTNYYHFAVNDEDALSFTVGFYIPEGYVESGEWMVGINTGERLAADRSDYLGNTRYTYYDIPPVSLND